MPKTPFGGSSGGLQPTTSLLGQINQNPNTTPDTRGIGTLSLDLSGQPKNNTNSQRAEGLGAVPGVIADAVTGGVGAALGGLGTILQAPINLVGGELKKGAIKRYMGEDPGPISEGLTMIARFADPYGTEENRQFTEKFKTYIKDSLPLPEPLEELAFRGIQEFAKFSARLPLAAAGAVLSRQKIVGSIGGMAFGPKLISNDPETLSTEVKSILDNGGTMEDALTHMKENYQWAGDDALTNFLVGVTLDPIMWYGYPISFSSKIGASQELAAAANGVNWQEFLAATTMNKGEIAVAKRMGFLGKSYNSTIGPGWERVKSFARATVVDATMNRIGVDILNEADEVAKEIGGTAPKLLANNINRTLNFMLVDASKSVLSRNSANGAREWAETVISEAGRGKEALAAMPEFSNTSDDILEYIVDKVKKYQSTYSDEARDELNKLLDDLRKERNIKLINDEVGGFFMKGAARIPFVGKRFRQEAIYAGRKAINRSLQRHEPDIVRALESGAPEDIAKMRSEYIAKMGSALDTTANGGTDVLERYFNKKFAKSQSLWALGKKEEAVSEMAKVIEVAQMNGVAKAVRLIQPLRKLTGKKITPVLSNRFSKETLERSIDDLQKAVDSGNAEEIARITNELVIQYQDLSFKYDNINFAKNLADDSLSIGKEVLLHMKRLHKEQAYVTRLPGSMISKMDEFEFGIAPAAAMGGKSAVPSMITKLFSNSKFSVEDVQSIGDVKHFMANEVTRDVLTDAVARGEDVSSWSNLARMQFDDAGNAAMPTQEQSAKIISDALTTLTASSKTGTIIPSATPSSNMWLQRNLSENMHTGVRVLEAVPTVRKNYFNAPLISSRSLSDLLEASITKVEDIAEDLKQSVEISSLIPDAGHAARLTDYPSAVAGYDGLYLYDVDKFGKVIVQKTAAPGNGTTTALELVWNRMSMSLFEDPDYVGLWKASNINLEKRNPALAIDQVFGEKFTASSGIDSLDKTFVGLQSTFPTNPGGRSVIPGGTQDGLALVESLSARDKERIFLDPSRILLGYITENSPSRSVPNLDRVIFRFSDKPGQENVLEAVQDMIGDLRFPLGGQWEPNRQIDNWLKAYLISSPNGKRVIDILAEGNASDMVVMKQLSKQEADVLGLTNPAPTVDLDATVSKILSGSDGISSYIFLAAKKLEETRSVSLNPGAVASADIRAWEKMVPISEDGGQKFSFPDLFHAIDNLNDPINRNLSNFTNANKLKSSLDEALYDAYYEFGAQGIRPFDFISYNNIPHSSGALLHGLTKNEFLSDLSKQVLDGKMTPIEAYATAVREMSLMDLGTVPFADEVVVKTFGRESGDIHRVLERLGMFVENRLSFISNTTTKTMRVYDAGGTPMLEPRFTAYGKNSKSGILTSIDVLNDTSTAFATSFIYPGGFDITALRVINGEVSDELAKNLAAKVAAQPEQITVDTSQPLTPEQAAEELANPGAAAKRAAEEAAKKDAAEQEAIAQLVKARAELRELGYEMGLEPEQPYIQSLDVMRDVSGNAVIRPRFDLYTSFDEVEDLSAFGMKNEDVLPLRGKGPLDRFKRAVAPVSNNEIYDSAVERLRYYVGNRISQEDSLRAMANIAEYAMKMEINPGGLGNEKLAEILIDVLGGGAKGLRAYNRAFGVAGANVSPRAALMYALQGRPEIIGWTTNLSKRLQARSETIAMIANKIYPLTRYRYNPYFNWQEGIEPYAFNILRGVAGQKAYEDGAMMARLLSMRGGGMADLHNVGPHLMVRNASVLQRISAPNPAIDIAVGQRVIDRLAKSGGEIAGNIAGASEKFRQSVSNAKEAASAAGTLNETIREAAPAILRDQPEVGLNWLEITGSIDPATNFRYFMDQSINGMMPTQIVRIADVSSAPHTFGAPIEESWLRPFEEVAALDNPTKAQIDDLEDISAVLEKVGGPIELRKNLATAARKYLASVKSTATAGARAIKAGRYFKGKMSITSIDNIQPQVEREIQGYTGNEFRRISKYLGAKAQYGVQLNNLKEDLAKMIKVNGDDDFTAIERQIANLDSGILNNRILSRGRIYRGFNFKTIIKDSDIANLKPGFRFGDESFLSWSKAENEALTSPAIEQAATGAHRTMLIIDDAKGIPGLDLNAIGSNVPTEEEVLLGRGMEFEIIEVLPTKVSNNHTVHYYKVKPVLQPQAVEVMAKLSPNDAARLELTNAISDIKIQQAKNVETYNDLVRLFKAYPDLLEGVREMGMKMGLEPSAPASVRYRPRKSPSLSPSKVNDFDPMATHDRYSNKLGEYTQTPQPSYLDSATVFGRMEAGPQASLNTGGKTGIWRGTDGIRRYVKTIRMYDPGASAQDFSDPHSIVNEFIVNRLLKKMGVAVPEVSLVADGDEVYLASQWVEGMLDLDRVPMTQEIAKGVMDNHVADMIVANFDAVGPDLKNMGIMPDGTIVRTDVGNSTFYRAGGGLKYNKRIMAVDPQMWEDVDPSFWWNPEVQNSLGGNKKYRDIIEMAYPELRTKNSTLEIGNFLEQYTDMVTRLGNVGKAVDEIVDSIRPFINTNRGYYISPNRRLDPIVGVGKAPTFDARIEETKKLLEKRINQVDAAVGRIREQRVAEWNAQLKNVMPGRRPKIRKQDKWISDLSERMASAQAEGVRLPGFDAAIATVKAGERLSETQVKAISNGLAPFIYKRGAMKQFIDSIAQMHAVGQKRIFKEQYYSTFKGSLERTFNHPILGPYPVSYMYGKVLPAFFDAMFKYAPFTSEFAPFAGFYRFDKFAEYIATELETNDEIYDYVMRRPPLIMFLSGLLPGWPTDIGVSLPYWFREGVMRPVAEGNFEDIPGSLARATATTAARQFGLGQTINRSIDAVTDIQSFLTGDPSTSVIDDISEFLSIKDSN